jgi:hypothetical protein
MVYNTPKPACKDQHSEQGPRCNFAEERASPLQINAQLKIGDFQDFGGSGEPIRTHGMTAAQHMSTNQKYPGTCTTHPDFESSR